MNYITRKLILGALILVVTIVGSIDLYRWYYDLPSIGETRYETCGTITFKSQSSHAHKSHVYTDYYFVINESGMLNTRDVTIATFSQYEVGDRVCFTDKDKGILCIFGFICAILVGLAIYFTVSLTVIFGIYYLVTGSL